MCLSNLDLEVCEYELGIKWYLKFFEIILCYKAWESFIVFYILKWLLPRTDLMASNLFIRQIHNSTICIQVYHLHVPPNPHPKEKFEMYDSRLEKHWTFWRGLKGKQRFTFSSCVRFPRTTTTNKVHNLAPSQAGISDRIVESNQPIGTSHAPWGSNKRQAHRACGHFWLWTVLREDVAFGLQDGIGHWRPTPAQPLRGTPHWAASRPAGLHGRKRLRCGGQTIPRKRQDILFPVKRQPRPKAR